MSQRKSLETFRVYKSCNAQKVLIKKVQTFKNIHLVTLSLLKLRPFLTRDDSVIIQLIPSFVKNVLKCILNLLVIAVQY
jgi:hypothetical protein